MGELQNPSTPQFTDLENGGDALRPKGWPALRTKGQIEAKLAGLDVGAPLMVDVAMRTIADTERRGRGAGCSRPEARVSQMF